MSSWNACRWDFCNIGEHCPIFLATVYFQKKKRIGAKWNFLFSFLFPTFEICIVHKIIQFCYLRDNLFTENHFISSESEHLLEALP